MCEIMHILLKHLPRAAVAAAWQARVNYQLALLASQQAGGQPLATGGLRGSRSLDPGLCAPPALLSLLATAEMAPCTPWLCRKSSNKPPDHTPVCTQPHSYSPICEAKGVELCAHSHCRASCDRLHSWLSTTQICKSCTLQHFTCWCSR